VEDKGIASQFIDLIIMKRAHIFVSGQVQGVFFRAFVSQKRQSLGLSGWVRNLPDGRVEAVAEGQEAKINQLVRWCRVGPPQARVQSVQVTWEEPEGLSGFEIRY